MPIDIYNVIIDQEHQNLLIIIGIQNICCCWRDIMRQYAKYDSKFYSWRWPVSWHMSDALEVVYAWHEKWFCCYTIYESHKNENSFVFGLYLYADDSSRPHTFSWTLFSIMMEFILPIWRYYLFRKFWLGIVLFRFGYLNKDVMNMKIK